MFLSKIRFFNQLRQHSKKQSSYGSLPNNCDIQVPDILQISIIYDIFINKTRVKYLDQISFQ